MTITTIVIVSFIAGISVGVLGTKYALIFALREKGRAYDVLRRYTAYGTTSMQGNPIFKTREKAEEALDDLVEFAIKYGQVSVSDFKNLIGFDSQFNDTKYGWKDLRSGYVTRTYKGYMITLPDAESLEVPDGER
jgi:hypothetical protein